MSLALSTRSPSKRQWTPRNTRLTAFSYIASTREANCLTWRMR
jgi:hypothetical protein